MVSESERALRLKWALVASVVISLGIVFLWIYTVLADEGFPEALIFEASIVLLSIGLVGLVYELLLRSELINHIAVLFQQNAEISNAGLVGLWSHRDLEKLKPLVESTERQFSILAITAYAPLYGLRGALIDRLSRLPPCFVRILVCDKDSPFLRAKEIEEDNPGRLRNELVGVEALASEIVEEASRNELIGRIEVRAYDAMPYSTLYIVDDRMGLYNPYVYKRRGVENPVFVLSRQRFLIQFFSSYFERLWNDAEVVMRFGPGTQTARGAFARLRVLLSKVVRRT